MGPTPISVEIGTVFEYKGRGVIIMSTFNLEMEWKQQIKLLIFMWKEKK